MSEQSRAAARSRLFAEYVHTGEGRISIALTLPELEELAYATLSDEMRARLITAIGLFDPDRADKIEQETK